MVWNTNKLPDLSGQVAIVTGGNAGLGYFSALGLAKKGCHVIVASRSEERGLAAVEKLIEESKNEKVEFMLLELASFASVKKFAEGFLNSGLPLNILICNAGIAFQAHRLTQDGITTQLQVNYLSHVYLEQLLEEKLIASSPSRIVNVSSGFAENAKIYWKQWENDFDSNGYDRVNAYAESKLAQCFWTYKLAEKLKPKGVLVNVVHPGIASTEIGFKIDKDIRGRLVAFAVKNLGQSSEKGAISSLVAAASNEVVEQNITGKLFGPNRLMFGNHKQRKPYQKNRTEQINKLWEKTYRLLESKTGSLS